MSRFGAVVVALLLTATLAGCNDGEKATKPDRLPDVTLAGFGESPPVDLGSVKGPAVVNLWASWCGPCKRELPIYADFARAYAGKVAVLGIDFQETSQKAATELLRSSGVAFPNVADPDGKTRAIGLPKLVLIDADGTIAYEEYVEIKSAAQLESLVAKHLGVSK